MHSAMVDAHVLGCIRQHTLEPALNEAIPICGKGIADSGFMFTGGGLGDDILTLVVALTLLWIVPPWVPPLDA